jgi:hypothetical protein
MGHKVRWIYQPATGTELIYAGQRAVVDFIRLSTGAVVFTVHGTSEQAEAFPWDLKVCG